MSLRANDEKGRTTNESVFFSVLATRKVPKWLDFSSEVAIRLLSKVLEKIRNQGSIDDNALSVELGVAKSTVKGALQHLVNLGYLVLIKLPDATCLGGALP